MRFFLLYSFGRLVCGDLNMQSIQSSNALYTVSDQVQSTFRVGSMPLLFLHACFGGCFRILGNRTNCGNKNNWYAF